MQINIRDNLFPWTYEITIDDWRIEKICGIYFIKFNYNGHRCSQWLNKSFNELKEVLDDG